MAYLRRRRDGRLEIRESFVTVKGPRARTLAIFRGALTPDVLEHAAVRARRPLDLETLRTRADSLGISLIARRGDRATRELLARLRRGEAVDPVLVTLLRSALATSRAAEIPEELQEVAGWVGVDAERRGHALRGLLRATDRLVRGRPARRARSGPRFPRFQSRQGRRRASRA